MKKIAAIALIAYLVVAGILLICAKDPLTEVRILSLRQDHSRLIASPEETLGIVVLVDAEGTFLTDRDAIRSARIADESGEMAVSTASVESAGIPLAYEGRTYYPYRFNLAFTEVYSTDLSVAFRDAMLEITYENEAVLEFSIGNLRLTFDDLENPNHWDLTRLFGVMGSENGEEILTGFVIGLETNVSSPLVLLGISIMSEGAGTDFESMVSLPESPDRQTPVEDLVGLESYVSIRETLPAESGSMLWPGDGLWFVPIVHLEEGRYLSRFPIVITYSYLGVEYRHVWDDFLFFSPENLPEVSLDDVCETTYRY